MRFQTAHFVIYVAKLSDQAAARMGLAVSRQIGNAVVRNRVKRRLRECFRCSLKPALSSEIAIMVVARKGAERLRTPEMTEELKPSLLRMARKVESALS